ncbi:HK97 gp10 family phage protein [Enterococcus faecalis]|uniref:HK97 gp10 family phage protein n=1 Tax=Enterococcus faecalis TaxID=1351 RepID=UPI00178309EF|nr:HK97 gp10 family phage protein [Enterococcus faecalis]MBD9846472.1 HK97 gp10 family phage protein [Enterococcus faecalis]
MGVEFRGVDRLMSKIRAIPKVMEDAVYEATFDIVEETATRATSRLQSSVKYGSGELSGSLKQEVVIDSRGKVVGRVWSDKIQALFREFGTGPVGAESPKDLPPGVNPVYSTECWFIPVNKTPVDLETVYGIPKVTIKGQDFFMSRGQPARPWLYPSMKEVTEMAEDIYRNRVREGLIKL